MEQPHLEQSMLMLNVRFNKMPSHLFILLINMINLFKYIYIFKVLLIAASAQAETITG